jgi:TniQ
VARASDSERQSATPSEGLTVPREFVDDYEDDGFASITGRTMLFSLEPIGIGTPQCESLTSYLVRLAREHSLPVRRFVSRLLFSQKPDRAPRCDAKFFRRYAATINGVGPYASLFSGALNDATGRTDLELLTLLPWRELLPANGTPLTSTGRRWCPHCLAPGAESLEQGTATAPAYMLLAWSIASVHNCARHGAPLADKCPHCSRRQPVLPRRADVVHCDSCHQSLAIGDLQTPAAAPGVVERTALSVLEQLIVLNASIDPTTVRQRWVDAVSRLCADLACDRATLCRRVGLNPRAMNSWVNKGTAVSVESLTKVIEGVKTSATRVFGPAARRAGRLVHSHGSSPVHTSPRVVHHPVEVRARTGCLLDQALAAAMPPKLCEVAAALGTSTGFVRYWHAEKVARLRERHLELERAAHEARLEHHRAEVAAAVERVRSSGKFPGRKAVEAALRTRGVSLIEPLNYRAYRAVLTSPTDDL